MTHSDRDPTKRPFDTESNHRIARATIVALHGSLALPPRFSGGTATLLPERKPVSLAQLQEHLAELSKPIVCVGFVVAGQLYVGTWMSSEPVGLGDDMITLVSELFRERYDPARALLPDVVVTAGQGDMAELTCSEYEQWLRDYEVPLANISLQPVPAHEQPTSSFIARVSAPDAGDWASDTTIE